MRRVELKTRASKPIAVLSLPVVLSLSAASPIAVLKLPVVSLKRVLRTRSLCSQRNREGRYSSGARRNRRLSGGRPVVLSESANAPLAVLVLPLVLLNERRKTGSGVGFSRVVNECLIANSSVSHVRNNHPNSCCARSAGWTCWPNGAYFARSAGWTLWSNGTCCARRAGWTYWSIGACCASWTL